ncbi:F-box/kelch-repeat protein At1g16250 [Linum grandiflorum]
MVNLRDSVYVISGRVVRRERSWTTHGEEEYEEVEIEVRSTVLRYNVQGDKWVQCGPLTQPRYSFPCCVCDDKIYVAGGNSSLTDTSGVSRAEVYDPVLDMWTSISNMSVMRYKCVGVTWKGKIYLVGGFASRVFIMERSSAEVYDTKTGKWEVIVGMWQLDVPPNEIVAVNKRLFSSGECLKPWKGHCYGPCCLLYGPKPLGLTVGVQL